MERLDRWCDFLEQKHFPQGGPVSVSIYGFAHNGMLHALRLLLGSRRFRNKRSVLAVGFNGEEAVSWVHQSLPCSKVHWTREFSPSDPKLSLLDPSIPQRERLVLINCPLYLDSTLRSWLNGCRDKLRVDVVFFESPRLIDKAIPSLKLFVKWGQPLDNTWGTAFSVRLIRPRSDGNSQRAPTFTLPIASEISLNFVQLDCWIPVR